MAVLTFKLKPGVIRRSPILSMPLNIGSCVFCINYKLLSWSSSGDESSLESLSMRFLLDGGVLKP
jgi:hypothetical protein